MAANSFITLLKCGKRIEKKKRIGRLVENKKNMYSALYIHSTSVLFIIGWKAV
jgi:hypothetical protein